MTSDTVRVGVIGLGKMGKPISRHLLKAGFPVIVFNRSKAAEEELAAEGAQRAGSLRDVAEAADIILTSLPDPIQVKAVYLERDGLAASARAGQVYIDTSTVDPETSRACGIALAEAGAEFLDAPVSGGVAGAEAASLTVMAGGDQETFDRARPVLDTIGGKLHLVGPTGAGTVIKLMNQLLVGINMAGVAEAIVLGVKAGADPDVALEVLSTSFGGSKMLDRGVPLIVNRDFAGGTPVDLIRKDLGLINALAENLGVPLATGSEAAGVFDTAHEQQHGDEDMTAIVQPLESASGVTVTRTKSR